MVTKVLQKAVNACSLLSRTSSTHVRFGSKADIGARPINVRFTPESGHEAAGL